MEWYLNLSGSPTYQAGILGYVFLLGFDIYQLSFVFLLRAIQSESYLEKGYLVPQERVRSLSKFPNG